MSMKTIIIVTIIITSVATLASLGMFLESSAASNSSWVTKEGTFKSTSISWRIKNTFFPSWLEAVQNVNRLNAQVKALKDSKEIIRLDDENSINNTEINIQLDGSVYFESMGKTFWNGNVFTFSGINPTSDTNPYLGIFGKDMQISNNLFKGESGVGGITTK